MLIKSLKIKNFRQFLGTTKLDFSLDPEKNVTVILGNNTFGKTTILQAFNWCFYDKVNFKENPDILLNYDLYYSMEDGENHDVEIEVVVLHDGTEYTITRTQNYKRNNGKVNSSPSSKVKVSYKQVDGQTKSVDPLEIKNVINTILPEDLSSYFFFDTERVDSISEKRDISEAVKGLLGLAEVDSAIKHLGDNKKKNSAIGKLYQSINHESNIKIKEAQDSINSSNTALESISERLKNCEQEISKYENVEEEIREILRTNKETADYQKKIEKLERKVKTNNNIISDRIKSFFKDFSKHGLYFFAQPLFEKTQSLLKEVNIDDKGVPDVTRSTIMELIERGYCLCGQKINKDDEAYQHLIKELSFVPPESVGNTVRFFIKDLNSNSEMGNHFYEKFEDDRNFILSLENSVDLDEEQIKEYTYKIEDQEDMSPYESQLLEVQKRLNNLRKNKEKLEKQKWENEKTIKEAEDELDELSKTSEENHKKAILIQYARTIKEKLEKLYEDKEKTLRKDLEDKVNEIFKSMYHGQRRVNIDSNYNVKLMASVSDQEIASGESEGSNRVKNFAFISGLVSLAKNKVNEKSSEDEINLTSEPYPLVMDAPFSNADEIHTANISKVLPKIAEQVIMFVMQKDWNYAEPVLYDRIGKLYNLNKKSETLTLLSN